MSRHRLDLVAAKGGAILFARNLLLAALASNVLFVLYIVWFHLGVLQIDIAGHIASAHVFRHAGFHHFSDQFFLGYVHNLSYPPLEDAVVAALSHLTGNDLELAYRVYLTGLVPFYVFSIARLGLAFRRPAAQTVWLLLMLVILNLDKPDLMRFQGLSFIDLLVTGLSAEVLGASFLLLLVRELSADEVSPRIAILLSLALLSHLVIGPVALLLALSSAMLRRSWGVAVQIAWSLLACAFFLVPLVAYREYLYSSTILRHPAYVLLLLALAALALLSRHRRYLAVPATGLMLLAPEAIRAAFLDLLQWEPPFPSYHYYRLTAVALVLLAWSAACLLEVDRASWQQRLAAGGAAAIFLLFLFTTFDLHRYPLSGPLYGQAPTAAVRLDSPAWAGRGFVIHHERPCDFYVDSLLAYQGYPLRFAKGLYWESSRSNTVLSSYLATLLGDSAVVLDYWYYTALPCPFLSCFLDHFAADYNVGWVAVDDGLAIDYLTPDRRSCYREVLAGGTAHFAWQRRQSLSVGDRTYGIYLLSPRTGLLGNGIAEAVSPDRLARLDTHRPWYFAEVMRANMDACQAGTVRRETFVPAAAHERLQQRLAGVELGSPDVPISFTKAADGEYEIHIASERPVLFAVKLNFFPGFELLDAAGERVEVFEGMGRVLGVGSGEMRLRYRRTPLMQAASVISVAALAGFALAALGRARRRAVS